MANNIFSREIEAGVPIKDLSQLKLFLGGAGNTGSHFLERAIHNFINNVFIVDFDSKGYEAHNFPHCSLLLNPAEDLGKKKAETLAVRASEKALSNSLYLGKTMDVKDIGPGIIKHFDFALGFFDNVSARKHLYEVSRRADIPFIEVGLSQRIVQLQAFDHSESAPCYCCYNDISDAVEQSCAQIYDNDLKNGIAAATDYFGSYAADMAISAIFNWNTEKIEKNIRYILYPNTLEIVKERKPKNPHCLVCSQETSDDDIIEIEGAVDETTYKELTEKLSRYGNFRPCLPDTFITTDYCSKCGKEKYLNAPKKRLKMSDIICPECINKSEDPYMSKRIAAKNQHLNLFDTVPAEYENYTLLQMGYPYGAYIDCMDDAGNFITVTLKGDLKIIKDYI